MVMDEYSRLVEQRKNLDKQIEEVYRKNRLEALYTCRDLIKRFNLLPAELGIKRMMKKGSATPKYMGPGGQTWAGRGRKPIWLQQAELEGKTAEDFRISPMEETTEEVEPPAPSESPSEEPTNQEQNF